MFSTHRRGGIRFFKIGPFTFTMSRRRTTLRASKPAARLVRRINHRAPAPIQSPVQYSLGFFQ